MTRLRIAVAQFNAVLGDLAGNSARILEFAQRAREAGAQVLLTPELALCGYPPEDLQHRIGGIEKQDGTGNISYDPLNHEKMVRLRAEKVRKVVENVPPLDRDACDG